MIFMVFATGVAVGTVTTLWLLSREESPRSEAVRGAENILRDHYRTKLRR